MSVALLAVVLAVQGPWVASPARPTVGDTVWLSRQVTAPPGWRVRAGKLDAGEEIEPLSNPAVLRAVGGWVVRYAVVAWSPGAHEVALPPLWRLAPDGRTDSLPGGVARIEVRAVIPDSVAHPKPPSRRSAPPGAIRSSRSRGHSRRWGWVPRDSPGAGGRNARSPLTLTFHWNVRSQTRAGSPAGNRRRSLRAPPPACGRRSRAPSPRPPPR